MEVDCGGDLEGGSESELLGTFCVWGWRVVLWRIPLASLRFIECHSGQTSAMAGRDMGDWYVYLRYQSGTNEDPEMFDLVVIGDGNTQPVALEFLASAISFFEATGLRLVENPAGRNRFAFRVDFRVD